MTVEPDPSLDQAKSSHPSKKSKTVSFSSTPEKIERRSKGGVPLHPPKKGSQRPKRIFLDDVRKSIDFSQEHFSQGSDTEDRLLGADNSPVPCLIAWPPSSRGTILSTLFVPVSTRGFRTFGCKRG